jgi:hypothetical protein
MLLILLLLGLAAASFWAGYVAAPHPFQFLSRAGVPCFLALAGLAGYFEVRERQAVGDLAEWIDPPPGITDVRYVPSTGEVQAISRFLSAMPTEGVGSWRQGVDGDAVAEAAGERRTEYWLISSRLPSDSILTLLRADAGGRGWEIGTDEPQWIILSRGPYILSVFLTDAWPESGTDIMYSLTHVDG